MRHFGTLLTVALLAFGHIATAAFTVSATKTELLFSFDSSATNRTVAELAPWQSSTDAATIPLFACNAHARKLALPRFDRERDRLYSFFVELRGGKPVGQMRYVEMDKRISEHEDSYPRTRSKKGLQVQMVDDAIALGVQHAGLNIDLGSSVKITPGADDLIWNMDGRSFAFNRAYIEGMDREIKELSSTGATVTLILLNYSHPGTEANRILQHPRYDPECPGHISEFNTSTPEGLAWFKAWVEFLADRYSIPGYPHGRVVNYIVGNEVNAHWDWANMGRVVLPQFAADYARCVRVCAAAVRKHSASSRVFISLEHDWNKLYAEPSEAQGFPGRLFIDRFNDIASSEGNFDWNLAFHPYPENLFDCRTWNDKTALPEEDSPRITFKNIEQLPKYFRRKELLFHCSPRHIILSEQGFHAPLTPEGEKLQAAAYCYAWRKIVNLNGVDAFILHRHVDNAAEGGLNLGLWRRDPNSVSTPQAKRPMYEVFRLADTPQWQSAFQFALPIIGLKSWNEVGPLK